METCPADTEEIRTVRLVMIFDKYLSIMNKIGYGMTSSCLNYVVNGICFSNVYSVNVCYLFQFSIIDIHIFFIALILMVFVCQIISLIIVIF